MWDVQHWEYSKVSLLYFHNAVRLNKEEGQWNIYCGHNTKLKQNPCIVISIKSAEKLSSRRQSVRGVVLLIRLQLIDPWYMLWRQLGV